MKGSSVFFAFLSGAIAGGVAALLFAPKSGRETREQIKDFVEDEAEQVRDFVDKNVTKAKKAVKKGRKIIDREIADIKEAIHEEFEPKPRHNPGHSK